MLNIADFEYWGDDGFCKVSNVEILQEDNKRLVIKAEVKGSMKSALAQLYQDQQKIIWINGDSIMNYPDLIKQYNVPVKPRDAKKVGNY